MHLPITSPLQSLRITGIAGKRLAAVVLFSFGLLQAGVASAQGFDSTLASKNNTELRAALTKFYTATFDGNESSVRQWFVPEYVQVSDGKVIHFNDFLSHLKVLKKSTKSMHFDVLDAAYTGNTLSDRHLVHIIKANGEPMDFEVIAFLHLNKEGKVYELNELSRLVKGGDASDSDLGSRTQ